MQIFTLCSFKGGTGKTSICINLGGIIAKLHKKKVLLVDFDSQANLSIGFGIGPDDVKTMGPVIQGYSEIRDVIQATSIKGLYVIPANAFLDGIERTPQLVNDPYAHERLKKALESVSKDFDYCFIDTPPSLGWLTQSAFFAAHKSIICAIPEAFSIIALRRLKEFQIWIRKYHEIDSFGLILSFWDGRGAVNKEFLEEIEHSFPGILFESKIRRDITVSRAVLKAQTVLEFDKNSRACEDYSALAKEFINR